MVTATGIGRDFTEEVPAFRLISTYTGAEVTAYVEEAISGVAAGASTLSVVSEATKAAPTMPTAFTAPELSRVVSLIPFAFLYAASMAATSLTVSCPAFIASFRS